MYHYNRQQRLFKNLLVSIPKATKLLLTSCIPAIKPDLPTIGEEVQWMNFNTNGSCNINRKTLFGSNILIKRKRNGKTRLSIHMVRIKRTFVLLLELSSEMPLNKCGFTCISKTIKVALLEYEIPKRYLHHLDLNYII